MNLKRFFHNYFFKNKVLDYTNKKGETIKIVLPLGVSVLDSLLKKGYDIPYSCKAGTCQTCILQAEKPSSTLKHAQKGLSKTQIALNHFLACSCIPETSLKVKAIDHKDALVETRVIRKERLNDSILRLQLEKPFDFKAGQFCNLYHPDGTPRSYSIASIPEDGVLEFHIKIIKEGKFSSWATNTLNENCILKIQGPVGECFHSPTEKTNSEESLLLCGIGTGLAPLYGIIKSALHSGYTNDIHLVLGGKQSNSFYFINELHALAKKHNNLKICLISIAPFSKGSDKNAYTVCQGDIYHYVKNTFSSLNNTSIFLCGAPSFVQKMKKQCFLSGASMKAIFSDEFLPSK